MSLSRRLIVTLTGAIMVLWLLGSASAFLVMRHELDKIFDSALQKTAQRLLALAIDDLDEDWDDDEVIEIGHAFVDVENEGYLTYQVRDEVGRVLLRSQDAPATPFPVPLTPGYAETEDRRIYTEVTDGGVIAIQVAHTLEDRRETLYESTAFLLLPLVLLIPAAIVAIWLTTRWAMRPVSQLQATIGARDRAHLDPITMDGLPRELVPMVDAVNRLMGRLAQALTAERSFASNSAHELRTPVATALAQAQRLQGVLGDTPGAAKAAQLATTLTRLAHLVEKLLQLARADAGIAADRAPIDVLPVLRLVVDEFARGADARDRVRLDDGGLDQLLARTDPDGFGIALRNLIENALIHGASDRPVEVTVGSDHRIHVTNHGPSVAPEALARLTRPFERGRSRADGTGLGLAIAKAMLTQAGGALEIRSPAPGWPDGFAAIVTIAAELEPT